MSNRKFLILGSRNYANRRILNEFQRAGHVAEIINPVKLLPFVDNNHNDKMYVANDKDEPKQIRKKAISAIVPRIGKDLQFFAKSVEHLNQNLGIPTTASATALLDAQDKIRTVQMLSRKGVKTPKTVAVKRPSNLKFFVNVLGGFPVVAKLIFGSQGIGVFILTEALSASTGLDAFASQGHSLLLQQFIETAKKDMKKHDFRAVVVDGKVVAAIKRNSVGDDFRTNASLKEDCEGVELSKEMSDIAIKAANAVGLACAGVDLAVDIQTGEIYCYEVNGNFNFKSTEKFSKKNVAKAIVDYAIKISQPSETTADVQNPVNAHFYSATDKVLAAIQYKRESDAGNTVPNFNVGLDGYDKGIGFLEFPDIGEDEEMSSDLEAKCFAI